MSPKPELLSSISRQIWEQKYRYTPGEHDARKAKPDATVEDTWRRVAKAAAEAEAKPLRRHWAAQFYDAMAGFGFIPAGRILAGAGTPRTVTLFNCFVMGRIDDDMGSIFQNVKEAALTMQQGGGIGHDFSTLRPAGAPVKGVGADASGPVSFMDVWDAMCRTIMSAGSRRGAMMGTLSCSHPDIETFIEAKRDPRRLRNFNLSVLVSDAFIAAVRADAPWPLSFEGKVYKTVPARELWDKIMRAAYDSAEPGVIFIDRINATNPLNYCEDIHATNPCGEQPLPPYGACLLGSINLARLIETPFEASARLNETRLDALVATAVRLLDNIIDISRFPLPQQREEALAKRRMGLGITGLADALIMCGLHYGSQEARTTAQHWMSRIKTSAYLASAALAREKGTFPAFDRDRYLATCHALGLPEAVRKAIAASGLRNGLLTSIAPTGTISLLAGNVSSGIEPVFDFIYRRRILEAGGLAREEVVEDYAYRLFRLKFGSTAPLPKVFVTAQDLKPEDHLAMQAALQPHVDASISKTVNCPEDIPFSAFKDIYLTAYDLGLKGCTAYRPNPITGAVLRTSTDAAPGGTEGPTALPNPPSSGAAERGTPPAVQAHPHGPPLPQPLTRDAVLSGFTYKLKWPGSDHAIYVTINDLVRDGRRQPFEIFINSKNLEHYAWTVALTRMISAVFRRGGDVSFVAEELKAVFDPRGGFWVEGRYAPSLLAEIGVIIERHLQNIKTQVAMPEPAYAPFARPAQDANLLPAPAPGGRAASPPPPGQNNGRACPRCGYPALIYQENCGICRNCGYSTCG